MKKHILFFSLLSIPYSFINISCNNGTETTVVTTQQESQDSSTSQESMGELSIKEKAVVTAFNKYKEFDPNDESITVIQTKFEDKLKDFLSNTSTQNYDFKKLKEAGITIIQSNDKKLRIFSWDDNQGGSMRSYSNAYQIINNGNATVKIIHNSMESSEQETLNFKKIYTLNINKKDNYILIGELPASNRSMYELVQIVNLKDNDINFKSNIIKNAEGLTNNLSVSYDYMELNSDKNENDEIENLISYKDATKEIMIPIINEEEIFTKKFTSYKFNGSNFEVKK